MHKDALTLIEKGYRVVEKNASTTHCHVFYDTTFINIWFKAHKFMPKESQPATSYDDIQEVIDYMEGKTEELDNFYDKLRGK